MSRVCKLNNRKKVLSGHKVSHSNRKTKRKFLPNLQNVSLFSEVLNKSISLRLTPSTVRSVEMNDGIDGYLLSRSSKSLGCEALKLKKQIEKAVVAKQAVA